MLLFAGCGKKADPRYSLEVYPDKVSNLMVSAESDRIILKWDMPNDWDRSAQVRVLRSALKLGGIECKNCPRIYALLQSIPLRDARSKEAGKFFYVDRNIREGFSYSYRVVICTYSGVCGEESNASEISVR